MIQLGSELTQNESWAVVKYGYMEKTHLKSIEASSLWPQQPPGLPMKTLPKRIIHFQRLSSFGIPGKISLSVAKLDSLTKKKRNLKEEEL